MKKLLFLLIGMALVMAAFAAGGRDAAGARQELRVVVQAWMLDRYDFNMITSKFERNHPGVNITINRVPIADVTTNMLEWSAGRTSNDIAIGGSREHAVMYAARNLIVPFEDSFFTGPYAKENWFPAFLELGNIEGTQYMIPFTGEVMFIVANKQLMRNAGLMDAAGNIRAPRNWNELFDMARRATITEDGRMRQAGLVIDWGANFMVYNYLVALQGLRGNIFEADGRTMDFTSPQAAELMTQWARFVREGVTPTDTFADLDAGRSNFRAGNVAMHMTAASRWIEAEAFLGKNSTTLIPIPGTIEHGSLAYIHGAVIPRVSPRIQLAKTFVKEALLDYEVHHTALNLNGKMSPLLAHYNRLENPDWPICIAATRTAINNPLYRDFARLDQFMQVELQRVITGAQSVPDTQRRLSDFIRTLDLSTGLR